MLKIQKWKDFNGNGYLQGVRHAAPYGDHFGLLWRPFWIQNGHQNTKILWFGKNLVSKLSGSSSCKLIIVIVFGIGSHGVGWCPLLLCNGNSSYYGSQMKFVRHIVFALFLIIIIIIIIITSPWLLSGDVLLFYVSFSLLFLLFLFFHTFLSARFLGDALIKLYETL